MVGIGGSLGACVYMFLDMLPAPRRPKPPPRRQNETQRNLNQVSGRSLVRFFEQFIETPGFPQLAGEWDYDEVTL